MMNEEIRIIFGDGITVKETVIPVAHLRYKGKSKTFAVWSLMGETPELIADDEPLYSVVTVDVNVYSDGNYIDLITEIKRLMKYNEWIWVEDSPEMHEEDTGFYHKTITFEKERSL
jgi:hypothetical protein